MTNCNANATNSIAKPTNSIGNGTNSIAILTNSIANGTNSIAKATNSIAKTCSVRWAVVQVLFNKIYYFNCSITCCLHDLICGDHI